MWFKCNDFALNIDTGPKYLRANRRPSTRPAHRAEFSPMARYDDGHSYASPDYLYVYRIANVLKPKPADVFYDIGSGAGRVLCVMARRRLKKCVGIELFEPLCEAARRNASRLRSRKTPIEIICGDASTADLSDGTIYFMFNPFGAATMRSVLDNIERSLNANPRVVTIAYHNAVLADLLSERNWLEEYHAFSTAGGAHVRFWRSRP
jgi:precorrin-6B methylase 2